MKLSPIAAFTFDPSAPFEQELVLSNLSSGTPGTIEIVLGDAEEDPRMAFIVVEIFDTEDSASCPVTEVTATIEKMLVKHFGYPAGWTFASHSESK